MLTAGIVSILFKFLKQPVVLGYLVAGLLVGPYVAGKSWINDIENAEHWAEVGMVFLLFSMGLEFSFKKLLQVGSTAIVGCLTIVIGMMTTGFLVGRALGFNEMNSLFLGSMLCMSSTTIVFKALDDLGLRQHKFAGISLGILVVEDLFAVVLMVLLASIAVKQSVEGGEMAMQIGKLVAYIILWFVLGIMIIPSFFRYCHKHLNDETMTIVALGLCLGMVLLATGAGFSAALGAFVMGSILAETIEAERIEKLVNPIKNMFGAIFFVSVGMMIDPALLLEYWLPITILSIVVVVGMIIFATVGVVLAGQHLKTAIQTGFTLVQVGEFSFILAQFGESIGVTEKYLYPVIVAVSVITTFVTPYVIKLSEPAYVKLDSLLPDKFKLLLENYSASRNTIREDSSFKILLRKVLVTVGIYLVLIVFTTTIYASYFSSYITETINRILENKYPWAGSAVALSIILMLIAPFIYQIATKHYHSKEARDLWHTGGVSRATVILLNIFRFILCTIIVVVCIDYYFAFTQGVLAGAAMIIVIVIYYSRKIANSSKTIEARFMNNLNAREISTENKRSYRKEFEKELLSYDLHIAEFELSPFSSFCGKQLMELGLRKVSNINLVRIIREGLVLNMPSGKDRLFPHDRLIVAGTDQQIKEFKSWLELGDIVSDLTMEKLSENKVPLTLEEFVITADMPFCGKSIIDSNIRKDANCAVLSIDNGEDVFMNPDPTIVLEEGYTVVLCGESAGIKKILGKKK